MMKRSPPPPSTAAALLALSLAAIGATSACIEAPPPPAPPDDPVVIEDSTEVLSFGVVPCERLDAWPFAVASTEQPFTIHHRTRAEADVALEIKALVERHWTAELALGFRAPLPDDGACGDDDTFDIFIWAGHVECYVDVVAEDLATPEDDYSSYMVVDPFGEYGGELLEATMAHELNHAMQAADDWDDASIIYEMTSTYIEEVIAADDAWRVLTLPDFQAHPDWSLDRYDDYETWYMYGAALYLFYLRDEHLGGDDAFVGEMWDRMRSPLGEPPSYQDALDQMLAPTTTFLDTVAEFAVHRFDAESVPVSTAPVTVHPMVLGTSYVEVSGPYTVTGDGVHELVVQDVDLAAGIISITVMPTAGETALTRTDDVVDVTISLP